MFSSLLLRELQLIEAASRLASSVTSALDVGEDLQPVAWTAEVAHQALTADRGGAMRTFLAVLANCIFFGAIAMVATPVMLVLYLCWTFLKKPENDPRNLEPPPPALVAAVCMTIGLAVFAATR